MEQEDSGITQDEVEQVAKTTKKLADNLPGMVEQNTGKQSTEEKKKKSDGQETQNGEQKAVTDQPTKREPLDVNQAMKTAESGFNCCSKVFSCFDNQPSAE